ncbi:MAG: ABC transporter ATP-binding protein [Elusimicrobiaceae bacterium]|nr:ABC transporter ATP-binding protein [Elusimicrobiaceae bacterium]
MTQALRVPVSIEINGLSKSFGAARALDTLTVTIAGGTLTGLVGPNGAGKTTLMRILAGLLVPDGERRPDSGAGARADGPRAVTFLRNGVPLASGALRGKTAYFPQEQSLYPDLSCLEHMEFFRDLYSVPKAEYERRARELFRLTRLEPFKNRKAGKLSGGMYKKLGLMCVLLHAPDILLLDEPTIGVDPVSRRELWELMYRFVGGNMTIVMSTSYMDEAERCDRVLLLDRGRMLRFGEPDQLLAQAGANGFESFFEPAGGAV